MKLSLIWYLFILCQSNVKLRKTIFKRDFIVHTSVFTSENVVLKKAIADTFCGERIGWNERVRKAMLLDEIYEASDIFTAGLRVLSMLLRFIFQIASGINHSYIE